MKAFAKVLAFLAGIIILIVAFAAMRFYVFAPKSRPATQVSAPRTPEAVERGRYLATSVAACMTCHSEIDESKPGDSIVPGRHGSGRDFGDLLGFPGHARSPNISSSADGLGGWTDGEILRAFREGISKDGRPLFPFMPYPTYAKQLTEADALALVAYLRTLPPISGKPRPTEIIFPVSMFARKAPAPAPTWADPLPKDPVARGRRLIEMASCADCHSTFDDRHQPLPGMYLAGGFKFAVPNKGTVSVPNLTPDPDTGIGRHTDEELLRAIKAGVGKDGRILYVMPWTAYTGMTDEDARAVVAALRTIPAVGNPVPKRTFKD